MSVDSMNEKIVRWAFVVGGLIALALVVIAVATVRLSSQFSTRNCLAKVALEHPATGRKALLVAGGMGAAGAGGGKSGSAAKRKKAIKACG
jgi:hypothetical protein